MPSGTYVDAATVVMFGCRGTRDSNINGAAGDYVGAECITALMQRIL